MNASCDPVATWERLRHTPQLIAELSGQRVGRETELRLQTRLRERYPADVVRAAVELIQARQRAREKFTRADRMWFDRRGVEQATDESVARHKARRFAGQRVVLDLCCGIGGDSIALAQQAPVIAVDEDPLACWFTRRNAEVYEVDARTQVVCADVRTLSGTAAVHIDPDGRAPRRAGSATAVRHRRLQELRPPLEELRELMSQYRSGAIKLSPAANFHGAFTDVEIELVSLRGECKEATVWFGSLRGEAPYRATVLPAGESLAGDPLAALAPVEPPGEYLYDPDSAVVRAGLVDVLAERLGLARMDADDDYLTSDRLILSPLATPLRILDALPNNERAIRNALRRYAFSHVEVRHRRVKISRPQRLLKGLPRGKAPPGVLVFARVAGRVTATIAQRVNQTTPGTGGAAEK